MRVFGGGGERRRWGDGDGGWLVDGAPVGFADSVSPGKELGVVGAGTLAGFMCRLRCLEADTRGVLSGKLVDRWEGLEPVLKPGIPRLGALG